jgi:hypothetical protein
VTGSPSLSNAGIDLLRDGFTAKGRCPLSAKASTLAAKRDREPCEFDDGVVLGIDDDKPE